MRSSRKELTRMVMEMAASTRSPGMTVDVGSDEGEGVDAANNNGEGFDADNDGREEGVCLQVALASTTGERFRAS
jgi:hypothetical protein